MNLSPFETEVINLKFDDAITAIRTLVHGVNIYHTEAIVHALHRSIMRKSNYVRWVVEKLLTYDVVTGGQFCKLLENETQITRMHMFGYYRYELQYELNRNQSDIAKQVNALLLEKKNLRKFQMDYEVNNRDYEMHPLSSVLDKPELFKYIVEYLG